MGAEVGRMRERRWLSGLVLAVALLLVPRAAHACPS
jgi:hypothetical protein